MYNQRSKTTYDIFCTPQKLSSKLLYSINMNQIIQTDENLVYIYHIHEVYRKCKHTCIHFFYFLILCMIHSITSKTHFVKVSNSLDANIKHTKIVCKFVPFKFWHSKLKKSRISDNEFLFCYWKLDSVYKT